MSLPPVPSVRAPQRPSLASPGEIPPSRRPRAWLGRLGLAALAGLGLLASQVGCQGRGRTDHPEAQLLAAGWIDAEVIGEATLDDPARLEILAEAGPRGRMLRLDRLLDLYDGARFGDDAEARDSLWLALGGHASTRGIDASREVVLRLLEEAYALEELAEATPGALSEDERGFVADAIMLLSTDMFWPDTAESLISQTLAYRVLAESGHPRLVDNAHWRLYDHVRGVLEGAVEVGPEARPEILVHALYAEREDLSPWLDDLAPHAQPPLPSPRQLWELLNRHREALEQVPRWRPVVAGRSEAEAELRETIMALLPRPRNLDWELAQLPRGTGRRESLAPVMLLEPGAITLEPTASEPRAIEPEAKIEEGSAKIAAMTARDGRGIVLLAAHPQLPAPEFAAALELTKAARVSLIELAVYEPRLAGKDSASDELGDQAEPGRGASDRVVVALPLHVARAEDMDPGARALREARIHVQLSGRGPRVRVDGRWLEAAPVLPSDLARLVASLRRAYPRERALSLALAPDVQPRQLVDVLATLVGGTDPAYFALGWLPDEPIVREIPATGEADRVLEVRGALGATPPSFELEGHEALGEDDRQRLARAGDAITDCVPELEAPLPRRGVTLSFSFDNGKLVEVDAAGRRLDRARLDAFASCAQDRLRGLRLREHPEPLEVALVARAAESQ